MTAAIILAGGSGRRMGSGIPKQFLKVDGKPILAYTLESLQAHPGIDLIEAVCLSGWQETVRSYAGQYGISKLTHFASGGSTCQESIYSGLRALEGICADDDTVVLHDGVRPLLEERVLTDVLAVCAHRGNAVAALPYHEQIFVADDAFSATRCIPRDRLRRVSTPQAYRFGPLLSAYREAFTRSLGVGESDYANTMLSALGRRVYFAQGSDRNLKLTTRDDLALFRAYLELKKRGEDNDAL